jgi:hypothetical protein
MARLSNAVSNCVGSISQLQRSAAPGGADDRLDLGLLSPAQRLGEDLRVAQDDRQQIVEVVRHAAGELADGLHLQRLLKLHLRLLALGNVADQVDGRGSAVPFDRTGGELAVEGCAVDAPVPCRRRGHLALFLLNVGPQAENEVAKIRVHDAERIPADQVRHGPRREHRGGASVGQHDPAVALDDHGVGVEFDQLPVVRFVLAKGLFRFQAGREVRVDRGHGFHLPVVSEHRELGRQEPQGPVAAIEQLVDREGFLAFDDGSVVFAPRFGERALEYLLGGLADDGLAAHAHEAFELLVDQQIPPVRILQGHRVRGVLDQAAELRLAPAQGRFVSGALVQGVV